MDRAPFASTGKTSAAGRALVIEFEGFSALAYRCPAGVWTIGYGHTKGVKPGDTCDELQAMVWLIEDLEDAEAAIRMLVKVPLTQGQFDALASFTFNLGIKRLAESTMLILLNTGRYKLAAKQLHLWVNAGGKRLEGLVRRRAAEADLFMRGIE